MTRIHQFNASRRNFLCERLYLSINIFTHIRMRVSIYKILDIVPFRLKSVGCIFGNENIRRDQIEHPITNLLLDFLFSLSL